MMAKVQVTVKLFLPLSSSRRAAFASCQFSWLFEFFSVKSAKAVNADLAAILKSNRDLETNMSLIQSKLPNYDNQSEFML